ncbi:SGNH/GDSL hydrolase family protein [Nocardia sp. NBC_01329]|uniref:SGNH/GDSL hydrolase family protein n=1 Tax=Nocardia sp. NBC_01329 TaxID=2903594 RepID=UPI002E13A2B8|nr:SGNH/GDSL hydrolase family protein [Nocardia sp. NBC_01329]
MIHRHLHTESDDPMLITSDNARALLHGAPWRRYAVLGDSIAQGVGDASAGYRDIGWAERVAEVLTAVNPGMAYLNTGRIGATSDQMLDEQLSRVLDFRPDLVHVSCGGNDLFHPGGDPDRLRANLDTAFSALAATGAQLCVFTVADVWETARMAPMRPMRPRMAELNEIVRAQAARHDALLVDLWEHPLRLRPDLMSADLIHFTTSGHAVVATEMIRALAQRISATAPQVGPARL